MEFSPIQNHILSKLKNAKTLRYRDMQPERTPNDLFNYHLQFLVKKGFVERSTRGYALADAGIKHVADPDIFDGQEKIASLFKINVITIVSRKNGKKIEILNQIRQSHPSFGKVGVIGGIVRKGEAIEVAAARKLNEETGLEGSFRILGIERRMMYVGGKLFSDVMFPIAYTDTFHGELKKETRFGHNMWVSIGTAIKNESGDFDSIRKIKDVLEAIRKGAVKKLSFFYEEDIQRQ